MTKRRDFGKNLNSGAYLKHLERYSVGDHNIKNAYNLDELEIKKVMKKNPLSINKDILAASALSIMNTRKITSLCVHKNKSIKRTIGLIHMHDILRSNIN